MEGRYCAKSGRIFNLETSELKVIYETSVDDSISFYRRVSCEQDYDVLIFILTVLSRIHGRGMYHGAGLPTR